MDEGATVSGVSRGHQRRLYDQRRQIWAQANSLRLIILDYRGFRTDRQGKLLRDPARDRLAIADALQAAGVLEEPSRARFHLKTYLRELEAGCFICRLVREDPALPVHHVVWRSDEAIAFLNRFPTVFGQVLVAPVDHVEQVTGDMTLHQYLGLQRIVYATAEALRLALRPERVYVLSLGSQQAVAHIHWHIVPCPPGTLFDEQQLALLDAQARGTLTLTEDEGATLAGMLREHLPAWMRDRRS
jgi:diadenosine tetraphosphate (Ap4A) HIT family hydrolase